MIVSGTMVSTSMSMFMVMPRAMVSMFMPMMMPWTVVSMWPMMVAVRMPRAMVMSGTMMPMGMVGKRGRVSAMHMTCKATPTMGGRVMVKHNMLAWVRWWIHDSSLWRFRVCLGLLCC